jgi:hypothetical protein
MHEELLAFMVSDLIKVLYLFTNFLLYYLKLPLFGICYFIGMVDDGLHVRDLQITDFHKGHLSHIIPVIDSRLTSHFQQSFIWCIKSSLWAI